jgi:hypothetical protein
MNLQIVLPFCKKDKPLLIRLLSWIQELGGCYENDALFVGANDTDALGLDHSVFRSHQFVQPPFSLKDETHPIGPNWLFEIAARSVKGPWLWMEPDCVPLREGWIKDIEAEYRLALEHKQEVLACVVALNDARFPSRIPSGTAVYPVDAIKKFYGKLQLNRKVAWDIQFANEVVKKTHTSQSIISRMNHLDAPTFVPVKTDKSPRTAMTLSTLPKAAALFHPNKDGTLIARLKERMGLEAKQEEVKQIVSVPKLVPFDPTIRPAPYDCPAPDNWKVSDFMGSVPLIACPTVVPKRTRSNRIIHVVQRWKPNDEQIDRRIFNALQSWIRLYMTGDVFPLHLWAFKRDSGAIGDNRKLPYLKDILNAGLQKCEKDDDIVLLTNDDSILHPDLGLALFVHFDFGFMNCVCTGRLNFKQGQQPEWSRQNEMEKFSNDIGRDAFAFRADWLRKALPTIPDMFVGEAQFDLVLGSLIRYSNDIKPTLKGRTKCFVKAELPFGWVMHEEHERGWMMGPTPAQKHNLKEAAAWYRKNGMEHMIDFDAEGKA